MAQLNMKRQRLQDKNQEPLEDLLSPGNFFHSLFGLEIPPVNRKSADPEKRIKYYISQKEPITVTIKHIVSNGRLSDWYMLAESEYSKLPVKILLKEFLPSINQNLFSEKYISQNIIDSCLRFLEYYIGYQCWVLPVFVKQNHILASRKEYLDTQYRFSFFNIDPKLRFRKKDRVSAKVIHKLDHVIFLECCGQEIRLKPDQFQAIIYKHLSQNNTILLKIKYLRVDRLQQRVINFKVKPILSSSDEWFIKVQNLKIGDILSGRVVRILKNGCIVKTQQLKIFSTFNKRRSIRLGKKFSLKIRNINYRTHRIYGSLI